MHNRAELPRDPSFTIRSETPRVRGRLTVPQIRDVILSANPCHQAVFLAMFQGGMGLGELIYWNTHGWPALREALRDDPQVIKIDLPGRKRRKNDRLFYTFLGPDAIAAIRAWLPHRPEEVTAIFTSNRGTPLTKSGLHAYWIRHLRKLGLTGAPKTGDRGHRTGRNPHELRDNFRSQWSKSPASHVVAEFLLGHQIDKLGYDKSWRDTAYYEQEYKKALPWLEIMSSGVPYGRVERSEVERLQDEVQGLKDQLSERRESDDVMNKLFQDPQFMRVLRAKLKEMKM
jgi:integrase